MNKTKLFLCVISLLFSFQNSAFAKNSCLTQYHKENIVSTKPKKLREAQAEEFAKILAVDAETQKLISNPWIAQYIYINFFSEKTERSELNRAFQDLVNSTEAKNVDIFDLINNKLAERLNDPDLKNKIQEMFANNNKGLMPGKFRSSFYAASSSMKQALALPLTIKRIKNLVNITFSQKNLDRGLFDFYGATQLGLKESQLRSWTKITGGFSAVRPGQIENVSPQLWTDILRFASETESPIEGYSTTSGDALKAVFPSLSLFMGKTVGQEQYHNKKKAEAIEKNEDPPPFCTNVWCMEENRHEVGTESIPQGVSGLKRKIPPTYSAEPPGDFLDPNYALKHLIGRNSSEWNANSVYLWLRSHSRDAANEWVNNILQDETKHMSIFSAAFKYVFGNQPNVRTKGMLDKIMSLKNAAQDNYSDSSVLENSKLTLFEFAIVHLYVEKRVREHLKTIPLKTMEKFFDSEVKTITPPPSEPISPELQVKIDELKAKEKAGRENLIRWKSEEQGMYLSLKRIEKEKNELIVSLIQNLFENFEGAEEYGSPKSKAILTQIDSLNIGLDSTSTELIKLSLRETLRDYQIMNNSFVQGRPDLLVKLKNAREGFIIENVTQKPVKVISTNKLTNNHHMIRIEKPGDLNLEPGMAMALTLNTKSGLDTRILSVSNSPNEKYLEFAVGVSDSTFKKRFTKLEEGDYVYVEKLRNQLPFVIDRPAVMIAGGIGITPFRSMLQYASENNSTQPMWLFYGNRSEIPFKSELDTMESNMANFNVVHTLTNPSTDWTGRKGRIDDKFLDEVLPQIPKNAIYYIVGSTEMIVGTKRNLMRLSIPENQIKIEAFGNQNQTNLEKTNLKESKKKDDETICLCHNVSKGAIETIISMGGDVNAIQTQTNAGTGCGACKCKIGSMLRCSKGGT